MKPTTRMRFAAGILFIALMPFGQVKGNSVTDTVVTCVPVFSNFSASICPGDSFLFDSTELYTTGVYIDTFTSVSGCDSVVTLSLTVTQTLSSTISADICVGSSYNFNGTQLTSTGIYTDTVTATAGCDSIVTLHLSVDSFLSSSISQTICAGSSYLFGGVELDTQGVYTDTISSTGGCDSIIILTLTVNAPFTYALTDSVCHGGSYSFNGHTLTATGTYFDTLTTGTGCDSIVALALTVLQPISSQYSAGICNGTSYNFNGRILTAAGTYRDTLTSVLGCDSVVTLRLSLVSVLNSSLSATFCRGDTFYFNGDTLTISGFYKDTLTSTGGCDSIVTLDLTYLPQANSSYNVSICHGTSYNFNGRTLTAPGTYWDTLSNVYGCDSVVTLGLTVETALFSSSNHRICSGSSYFFNGDSLTTAGIYTDTLTASTGCDSIITVNLAVSPPAINSVYQTICLGEDYSFFGRILSATGIYTDTLTTGTGCDSVIKLNLTVNPVNTTQLVQNICDGTTYNFNGQIISAAGTYYDTLSTHAGCDSIIVLTAAIIPNPVQPVITVDSDTLVSTPAISYQWYVNGTTLVYDTSQTLVVGRTGYYTVQITDTNGCSINSEPYTYNPGFNAISTISSGSINLYPNPNNGTFLLLFGDNMPHEVKLLDALGNLLSAAEKVTGQKVYQLNWLAAGMYFIQVKTGEETTALRFVVAR